MTSDSMQGFTLLEVMVALVLLSVGLLGLQALGIHSARSVGRAEKQTAQTIVAARYLEQAVDSANTGFLSGNVTFVTERGDTIRRVVQSGTNPPYIIVTLIPAPGAPGGLTRADSVVLRSTFGSP